ncbi:MAG: hypothetical protein RL219_2328, partial [Actinomycetota bacterium]
MSHRQVKTHGHRSLVGVALVSVLAMVAAACGSSNTSGSADSTPAPVGAQEDVATSADWNFQMLNPDGTPLALRDAVDGTKVNGYLVNNNNIYPLRATVPAEVLASTTAIVLEVRTPDGVWDDSGILLAVFDASGAPMRLPADASGTAEGKFGAGAAFLGPHEFRLRAQNKYPEQVVAYSNVYQATGFETSRTVVATTSDWGFQMLKPDGTPLTTLPAADGTQVAAYAINKTYQLRAKLPPNVVEDTVAVGLQVKGENDLWFVVDGVDISVNASGEITGTLAVGPYFFGPQEVRLRAATRVDNKLTDLAYSNSVRATGFLEHTVTLVNNTTNDLFVYIPIGPYDSAKDEWPEQQVSLAQGERKMVVYINPEAGSALHLKVTKQQCFMGCTVHLMDWEWDPDGVQSCSKRTVRVGSGGDYTVTLSDDIDGKSAGFKVGKLEGPLDGPGAATTSCTFALRTHTGLWIKSHPWKAVGIGIAIVALVIVTVIVAVVLAPVVIEALGLAGAETVTAGAEESLIVEGENLIV